MAVLKDSGKDKDVVSLQLEDRKPIPALSGFWVGSPQAGLERAESYDSQGVCQDGGTVPLLLSKDEAQRLLRWYDPRHYTQVIVEVFISQGLKPGHF